MGKQINLVRYFDEQPDTIFTARVDLQTKVSYLEVHFPSQTIICPDPHAGLITDIYFMLMGGQKVVFTACQDMKMRAFSFKPDN